MTVRNTGFPPPKAGGAGQRQDFMIRVMTLVSALYVQIRYFALYPLSEVFKVGLLGIEWFAKTKTYVLNQIFCFMTLCVISYRLGLAAP